MVFGISVFFSVYKKPPRKESNYINLVKKIDSIFSSPADGRVFVLADTGLNSTNNIYDFSPESERGYYYDTIHIRDAMHRADFTLYCLQNSNYEMDEFNKAVKKEFMFLVNNEKKHLTKYSEKKTFEPVYTFEIGPFELFRNSSLLSLCCIIDTYSEGGNHHNYSWYTFNYDLENKKVIRFKDVFSLKSRKDSLNFLELVSNHIKTRNVIVNWDTEKHSIDFSILKNGICFNPELSWACGMLRSFVPTESLQPFLTKKWIEKLSKQDSSVMELLNN
jgi:hypothetical protein